MTEDPDSRSSWRGIALVLALLLASAGYFIIMASDRPSSVRVHFIVPDAFRGLFRLVEDSDTGITIKREGGVVTYKILPDGELRVHNMKPLRNWHTTVASYENGVIIPDGLKVSSDVVAFHGLDTESDGTTWYLIGTEEDKLDALDDFFGRELGSVQIHPAETQPNENG